MASAEAAAIGASTLSPFPVVSICMPTHGRPALLERALSSVVNGGARNASRVEIIVSDNSPELNAPVCERMLPLWPGPTRHIANESNIGAIPNFNQSGREATGTYLLFLHDDDRLLPGALDRIIDSVLGLHGDRAVYVFGVDVVDEAGRVRRRQTFRAVRALPPAAALRRVLNDSAFVRMPGLVLRRDVFVSLGGFDESVGNPTDFELMIRVLSAHGVTCVPVLTAQYMIHSQAATSSMFNESTISVLMKLFERAARTDLLPHATIRRAQANFFHQFILGGAYRELREGRPGEARTVLSLFELPEVRDLGRSRRWAAVRWLFSAVVRVPLGVSAPILRWLGRLNPEHLWHSR
jgi:glycosyltransferase involved in cell wall biosynthesis